MQYWLVKSEPDAFSWDQQVANGVEPWTGVRNYTARHNLKAMKKGDRAFFYHSNQGKEIVGVVEVVREAYPDPTAEKGAWVCVDMKAVAPMPKPVTLVAIKADPEAGRHGAGAAVAAVGDAGVEAALGPDLPDGRMEGMSEDGEAPSPHSLPAGGGGAQWRSPSPCGRGWAERAARALPLDEIPDGGSKGFPPPPGGFTGLFAVRQGDAVHVYVNSCPHIGTPLDWMPDRFLSADGEPYHLRHARRRVPHRRWRMRARPVLRRPAGTRHDRDQGRHHLCARGCRPVEPERSGRKHVHARCASGRRTDLSGQARDRREGAHHRRALSGHVRARGARPERVLGRAVASHRLDEAADQDQEHQLRRQRARSSGSRTAR